MAPSVLKASDKITDEDRQPGVVYIGHVPHGFFEKQLRSYFSQFGRVLRVKLSRSMKSGKSKGYAFIKFQYAAVAKTVAETCHNYLFFNRLLKCEYRPLSDVHKDTFFNYKWKANNKQKRQHNGTKTEEKLEELLRRSARRKQGKLNKLKELGLDLNLDDVMNVPEIAKRKPKTDVQKKSENVENSSETSATPSVSTKTLKRTRKASSKGRKAKPPASPRAATPAPKTLSSKAKGKAAKSPGSAPAPKVKSPGSTPAPKAKSPGSAPAPKAKSPGSAPAPKAKSPSQPKETIPKKATKAPPAGVKGRKPKPPPAKRVKKE